MVASRSQEAGAGDRIGPERNVSGEPFIAQEMYAPVARRRRLRMPKSAFRRAGYSILVVVVVEVIGTLGFHALQPGMTWVDAFYTESMLATGQGPSLPLTNDASKIFASLMGFISVGSVLASALFVLGPIMLSLWREMIEMAEKEAHKLEKEVASGVRKLEEDLEHKKGKGD